MKIKVAMLTCQHCVKRVEDAVKKISGVKKVKVDLKTKEVDITGEPDKNILFSAIKEAGYQAEDL